MITWRELMNRAFKESGETWGDVVSSTISDAELDVKFDNGFGGVEGIPFTIWTAKRVYFPTEYDGAESVASVSRDPDGKPTPHVS